MEFTKAELELIFEDINWIHKEGGRNLANWRDREALLQKLIEHILPNQVTKH